VKLAVSDEGVIAVYQWHTFRFLFSDGTTFDVKAIRDDSDMREAVRLHVGAERIEGVALVDDPLEAVVKTPVKRQVTRRATP